MRACARPDSGVHEINHFCQSLPLTLIKSMPLYRRQLRRRLWQRGVLSRTKCHGVHYLLQEAWGKKCDAAPVSKKRSTVRGPLRSERVCEVDISLNPYQWHIFQAVTSWPSRVSFCIPYCEWLLPRVSKGAISDVCDVSVVLCTYLTWGTRETYRTDRHMRRKREKRQDENADNTTVMHNCTLSNVKFKCSGIDFSPGGWVVQNHDQLCFDNV